MADRNPDTCDFSTREEMVAGIAIGKTVLCFDENHRYYGEKGDRSGPIYRHKFRCVKVEGETSRSWVLRGWGLKIPKKTLAGIYSGQCADRRTWMQENSHRVARALEATFWRGENAELCVEIAGRLGVDMPPFPGDGEHTYTLCENFADLIRGRK